MSNEEIVLICARVAHLHTPSEGSVMKDCSRCGSAIWVSSKSISNVIIAHSVAPTLICLPCAMPDIEREGIDKIVAETEAIR